MKLIRRLQLFLVATPAFIVLHLMFLKFTGEYDSTTTEEELVRDVFSSYDDHTVTKVMILGYQRSGSSFLGYLFNANPDALFLYEPLDSVYSAMYGASQGWSIPTDIFSFSNGTSRVIPLSEREALAQTLNNFLTCNLHAMPTEVFTHSFNSFFHRHQKRINAFTSCVRKAQKPANISSVMCLKEIRKHCPRRFNPSDNKTKICKTFMWDVRANLSDYSHTKWDDVLSRYPRSQRKSGFKELLKSFKNYHKCMSKLTRTISHCVNEFQLVCESSKIKAVKTVRATMNTVEDLLAINSDMQFFHLIRDPRPVSISRLKQTSFRGAKSGKIPETEAKLYCDTVVRDVRLRDSLSLKYPNKIKQVIYEDFVSSPLNHTLDMYKTIHSPVPMEVKDWITSYTSELKNSSVIASSWTAKMNYDTARKINSDCKVFYETVHYNWL